MRSSRQNKIVFMKKLIALPIVMLALSLSAGIKETGWTSTTNPAAARTALGALPTNAVLNGNITGSAPGLSVGSAAVATNAALGSPIATNTVNVELYPGKIARISTGTNSYYTNWPASTTAGWNEIQAMFYTRTNSAHSPMPKVTIAPGLYRFQSGMVISNQCIIEGAGQAATIFLYDGTTNFYTYAKIATAETAAFAVNQSALLMFDQSSDKHWSGGAEESDVWNVQLRDFSITIATNMYCVGIGNIHGDRTLLRNIAVGGPEMWRKPAYFNLWTKYDQISEPSKMIGFLLGDNQPALENCTAIACQVGIFAIGNSIASIRYFNGISCGNSAQRAGGGFAFPKGSDFHFGAALTVASFSAMETLTVDTFLAYECDFNILVLGAGDITIRNWRDQQSLQQGIGYFREVGVDLGASIYTLNKIASFAVTNSGYGLGGDFGIDTTQSSAAQRQLITPYELGVGGGFQFWNGTENMLELYKDVSGTGEDYFSFSAHCRTNIVFKSGYGPVGNGSGLTNGSPALATNNATASDGQVLSRSGSNLKWIAAGGGGGDVYSNTVVTFNTVNSTNVNATNFFAGYLQVGRGIILTNAGTNIVSSEIVTNLNHGTSVATLGVAADGLLTTNGVSSGAAVCTMRNYGGASLVWSSGTITITNYVTGYNSSGAIFGFNLANGNITNKVPGEFFFSISAMGMNGADATLVLFTNGVAVAVGALITSPSRGGVYNFEANLPANCYSYITTSAALTNYTFRAEKLP
jgi:hypothetical protein